jgi:hypothetical protein
MGLTRHDSLGNMTAQIGAHGLDIFGDPRPELLFRVTGIQPKAGRRWVDLKPYGIRSTQRLWISGFAGGVAMATWPTELVPQAQYLYGRGLGSALVTAALDHEWIVNSSPHLAYWRSSAARRLYMSPSISLFDYLARWEDEDGLGRVGRYAVENVELGPWQWLKRNGLADDGDDDELRRFLDEFVPRGRGVDVRPGLRFRRVWTPTQADELGPLLAKTMRDEFDAVFAVAGELSLSSAQS